MDRERDEYEKEEYIDMADESPEHPRRVLSAASYYERTRSGSKTSDDESLPSWEPDPSNPQSGIEDRDIYRNTLVFTAKEKKSTCSFTVLLFSLLGCFMYMTSRKTMKVAMYEANEMVQFTEKMNRQLLFAEQDMRKLERELSALDVIEQKNEDIEEEKKVMEQAAMFANPEMIKEMSTVQNKLRYAEAKARDLKQRVIEISKKDTLEKYGAGPHRVEIELVFPGNLDGPSTFVIEMAPVDVMPHSVHTFLEMVSYGLLDGCSFILNAMHVLKAAPLPYDGSAPDAKAQAFYEHGLTSVAFREYSHDYQHKPYTVGFAADGTPSFYINTEDNTEIHVGDPCFGKVISGMQAVKRLENSPTRNGIWFETRIGILRAVIL